VVPPTGGPKDTIPPTLIKSIPSNEEVKYQGANVELIFDEAIALKNAKEEIIITPSTGKETQFLARKNSVIIRPSKPFESGITYSIAFRQAIVDLNEANPAEDLKLAFSTGEFIDSLKIHGRVQKWPEDVPAEKITVAIYQSDTFNILKSQPGIFTRTDKRGRFSLTNLKPGKYFIYAFEDKNKNLRADSQTELIAFLNDTIKTHHQKDSIKLFATKLDARPLKINSYRNISNYGIIRLNKNIVGYKLTNLTGDKKILSQFAQTQNEILYYPETVVGDSARVKLSVLDSAGFVADSTFYIKQTPQKPIKEIFKLSVIKTRNFEGEPNSSITLNTNLPLVKQLQDSLLVLKDTIPLFKRKFSAQYDSIYRKVEIVTQIQLPDSIKNTDVSVGLPAATFVSIFNDSSTALTIKIPARKQATMARLILESAKNSDKVLIQALNEKGEIIHQEPLRKRILFKNLPPENISLRAIHDTNGNNSWDPGHPTNKRPPEKITYYRNENGDRKIPLRANWELTVSWDPE